jgi:hypothetical protein
VFFSPPPASPRADSLLDQLPGNRPFSEEIAKVDGVLATTVASRNQIVGFDISHHFLPTATTKYADKPSIINYQLPMTNYGPAWPATINERPTAKKNAGHVRFPPQEIQTEPITNPLLTRRLLSELEGPG